MQYIPAFPQLQRYRTGKISSHCLLSVNIWQQFLALGWKNFVPWKYTSSYNYQPYNVRDQIVNLKLNFALEQYVCGELYACLQFASSNFFPHRTRRSGSSEQDSGNVCMQFMFTLSVSFNFILECIFSSVK